MSPTTQRFLLLITVTTIFLAGCGTSQVETEQGPTRIAETNTPVSPQASPSPTTAIETTVPTPTTELAIQTPTTIPYTTPDWFENAVIYEIFVRSFRDSDGDGVGDLLGVTESLDYIESIGANTLWLMPIYPSPSQHGYDVMDFFDINPDYGDIEDLQTLVEEAHARDLRVILDFVPSHLSNQNPLFADAYSNPESELSDWFVWTNDNHTLYASFAGNEQMPRFNHFNPEVVDYLTETALYWLDLDGDGDYRDGVDGFRVDNATFPPQEFLMELRQGVKSANPDALLLGETWVHNPSDLSRYYVDQFDALFDFPLYEVLQGNRDFNGDGILAGEGFPILLTTLFNEEAEKFPREAIAVRFLSNHDTNRNATELKNDPARLKLAAALLAGLPGPIMFYYGEEIGMSGQKGGPPDYDNYRREPMDWYADEEGEGQATWFRPDDRWNEPLDGISVEEQDLNRDSLLNYYRNLIDLRKSHKALHEGDFKVVELETSGIGPWGFVRSSGDESILALFNFGSDEQELVLDEFPFKVDELIDLITGNRFPSPTPGIAYKLHLPPASALLLSAVN